MALLGHLLLLVYERAGFAETARYQHRTNGGVHEFVRMTRASTPVGMGVSDVLAVLDGLAHAGCRTWVGGGWGVDALAGRQTRPHRDLDLAIDADDEAPAIEALELLGFAVETDWRPVRVEFVAAPGRRVDLHPVAFDSDGNGRQADVDGGHFDYPRGCFTSGAIGGVAVPCLSVDQQLRFHAGYEHRDTDRHDVALLNARTRSRSRRGRRRRPRRLEGP